MSVKTIKFDNGSEVEADIIAKALNVIVATVDDEYKLINVKHIINKEVLQ